MVLYGKEKEPISIGYVPVCVGQRRNPGNSHKRQDKHNQAKVLLPFYIDVSHFWNKIMPHSPLFQQYLYIVSANETYKSFDIKLNFERQSQKL